ncbi:MAG: hypothetical protein WB615_05760 [Candidatus Tumulicola sp.]
MLRRLAPALGGVAISAVLLRGQLADALVVRGDECLFRARPAASLRYYRRAIWIDPRDSVAVDRLLFVAMTLRDRRALDDGIVSATRYLEWKPDDNVVRLDRAMACRVTGRQSEALGDFAIVGRATHDARALTFAGYAAQAIGQPRRASYFWRAALLLSPDFPAAKHALARAAASP